MRGAWDLGAEDVGCRRPAKRVPKSSHYHHSDDAGLDLITWTRNGAQASHRHVAGCLDRSTNEELQPVMLAQVP